MFISAHTVTVSHRLSKCKSNDWGSEPLDNLFRQEPVISVMLVRLFKSSNRIGVACPHGIMTSQHPFLSNLNELELSPNLNELDGQNYKYSIMYST